MDMSIRTDAARTLAIARTVCGELIHRVPEREAIYMAISADLQRMRQLSQHEQCLMHQYASALVIHGDAADEPKGLSPELARHLHTLVTKHQNHYRQFHPWRSHARTAA